MKEEPKDYWADIANSTKLGRYLTQIELELLTDAIRDLKPPLHCLDVGAGSGRFSIPLKLRGFDVFAIDNDPLPTKKLREKNNQIPTVQADGQKLPFKDGVFDFVVGVEVIDYLDIDVFLEECNRVLKPKGLLMFVCSNKQSYKTLFRPIIKKLRKETLYTEFYRLSFHEIRKRLDTAGFNLEKATGFNWLPVGRASNSGFIPFYSFLERLFGLRNLPQISPWVFFVARKKGNSR